MTLTPEQFEKLVTKDDLNERLSDMATKQDVNTILTAVDGLAKKFDKFDGEMTANQAAHDRYEESIKELKTKVRILEAKVN